MALCDVLTAVAPGKLYPGFILLKVRFRIAMTLCHHYTDVIVGAIASQITSLIIVYSTVYSGANKRTHQSSASLAFVPVNSPHKWPVTRKMVPFDDVIMTSRGLGNHVCVCLYGPCNISVYNMTVWIFGAKL